MEDFSEITDLETARRVLIGYDKAFREHAEIHTEMKDEIERLREELENMHRRERSTAVQNLGNEGQLCDEIERLREDKEMWADATAKAQQEIESLRKAYGLVRDAHEDTAKELSKYIRLSGDQIDEVARLRKRDGFINILDKQIVAKDAEIERLREALMKIADFDLYGDYSNAYEIQPIARAALKGDE